MEEASQHWLHRFYTTGHPPPIKATSSCSNYAASSYTSNLAALIHNRHPVKHVAAVETHMPRRLQPDLPCRAPQKYPACRTETFNQPMGATNGCSAIRLQTPLPPTSMHHPRCSTVRPARPTGPACVWECKGNGHRTSQYTLLSYTKRGNARGHPVITPGMRHIPTSCADRQVAPAHPVPLPYC